MISYNLFCHAALYLTKEIRYTYTTSFTELQYNRLDGIAEFRSDNINFYCFRNTRISLHTLRTGQKAVPNDII